MLSPQTDNCTRHAQRHHCGTPSDSARWIKRRGQWILVIRGSHVPRTVDVCDKSSSHIAVAVQDNRQPAWAVGDLPFVVGRLPDDYNPLRSATSAVVRPIPSRTVHLLASICANKLNVPLAAICTIVVPVPCQFAPLLKLLIRNRPSTSFPLLMGTCATPYGFTSPFVGTVVLTVVTVLRGPMKRLSGSRRGAGRSHSQCHEAQHAD